MSPVVSRCTDKAWMRRIAMGLYAGRVNACSIRDSSTWLQSMTALISASARKDGFCRNTDQYSS